MNIIAWDTFFGLILGVSLFVYSIAASTDHPAMFVSIASLGMVLGGTFAATFISYKGFYVFKALKDLFKTIAPIPIGKRELLRDIDKLLGWNDEIAQSGMAILDDKIETIDKQKDELLYYGLNLISTGTKGENLKKLLLRFTATTYERSNTQVNILKSMGSYAPAFGMIGTVVGLIIMLDGMQGDPTQLGQGLALALITTLYGVILSNLIFKPAALKIEQKNQLHRFRNRVLSETLYLMSDKIDTLHLQDELNSYLDSALHFDVLNEPQK